MLEDIHWADAASLRLFEFIAPDVADQKLMIACSFRDAGLPPGHTLPGAIGQVSRETRSQRIELMGLQTENIRQLLEAVAEAEPPRTLVDATLEQTRGNPLFATETIKLLVAENRLNSQAYATQSDWKLGVPNGVTGSIGQRLAAVPN